MFTLFVDSLVPIEVEKYNDAFFDLHLGDVDFTSPTLAAIVNVLVFSFLRCISQLKNAYFD